MSVTPLQPNIPHRPDIDGLRAFAIVSVVIYHIFPSFIPGGFVGVDVFFVISGYLIGKNIILGLTANCFDFIEFYSRRVKRIFPALIVVLIFCLFTGTIFLLRDEYSQLGKHTVAGVFFLSNILLFREGGYFEIASEMKPLLHLWSLSIEEQFYLFWPLVLWYIWGKGIKIRWVVVILLILSFSYNLLLVSNESDRSFFLPFSRFWQLIAGTLIAELECNHINLKNRVHRNILSISGVLLIFMAIFAFSDSLIYPGAWAVVPTVGAMLFIIGGSNAWINREIFSGRLIVSIGLISYPLYLWHWPILYFTKVVYGTEISLLLSIVVLILSFLLSWVTYRVIEQPIRRMTNSSSVIAGGLLLAMLAPLFGGLAAYHSVFPMRIPTEWQNVGQARQERYAPRSWGGDRILTANYLGNNKQVDVVFFGDSHLENYYPRIKQLIDSGRVNERGVAFLTAGGCPPLPRIDRIVSSRESGCDQFFSKAIGFIKDTRPKKLVLGAYWDGYFLGLIDNPGVPPLLHLVGDQQRHPLHLHAREASEVFSEFESELMQLVRLGIEIYIVLPNPAAKAFDPSSALAALDRTTFLQWSLPSNQSIERVKLEEFLLPVVEKLKLVARNTNSHIIDPVPSICLKDRCEMLRFGHPINTDTDHLSASFVMNHADYIDNIFDLK